jgi:hypothetical protein
MLAWAVGAGKGVSAMVWLGPADGINAAARRTKLPQAQSILLQMICCHPASDGRCAIQRLCNALRKNKKNPKFWWRTCLQQKIVKLHLQLQM